MSTEHDTDPAPEAVKRVPLATELVEMQTDSEHAARIAHEIICIVFEPITKVAIFSLDWIVVFVNWVTRIISTIAERLFDIVRHR